MKTRSLVALTAVLVVAIAGPASALIGSTSTLGTSAVKPATTSNADSGGNGSTSGIHDSTKTDRQYCNDQHSQWIEYQGPSEIWPPNHKMRNYTIVAHDDNGGQVTLATIVSSSQPLDGPGDGNTDVDYTDNTPAGADSGTGEARNSGQVRGERSGLDKSGRTYTFDSTAMFTPGGSCHKTFTAHVPHDQRDHTNSGH